MTPLQARTLAAFRSRHRIVARRDYDDDYRAGYVERCETDHLRVYQYRDGSWRHDLSDVRRWTAVPAVTIEVLADHEAVIERGVATLARTPRRHRIPASHVDRRSPS